MATPVKKAKAIEDLLDILAEDAFGRTRTEAIEQDICVDCGNDAREFNSERARREYAISGLCQVCQDEIFLHGDEFGDYLQ